MTEILRNEYGLEAADIELIMQILAELTKSKGE